jgi:hypothetical protein
MTLALHPVTDSRVHGRMVGRCRDDPHGPVVEDDAVGHLLHLAGGPPREVAMVCHAVPDVFFEHGQRQIGQAPRSDRSDHAQWLLGRGHGPAHGHDVIEVSGVVAVQVREQDGVEPEWSRAGSCAAHEHTSAAIEEEVSAARAHERGRSRPIGVGQRTPRTQRDDLHGDAPRAIRASGAARSPLTTRLLRCVVSPRRRGEERIASPR